MIKDIKKILSTLIIVLLIFLLLVVLGLISSVLKKSCSEENPQCPENYLCNFNKNTCVQAENCPEQKQEVCITLFDPVCSNGKQYSNGCFACVGGVASYYKGSC
jgi:flagellar basal body-associated protein FliL